MTPEIKRQVWAWMRGASLGLIGYAAIVPLAAGRWDWLWGWVYIGLLAAALAAHPLVLVPINPLNMHARESTSIGRSISGKLPFSSSMLPAAPTPTRVPSVSRKLMRNNVKSTGSKLKRSTPRMSSLKAIALRS